ncbi:MAG: hypothetical protein IJ945_02925 [Oscillospiraceae bacterium]|nr:hypothetical protein [Oscillospiraceae bacterium]
MNINAKKPFSTAWQELSGNGKTTEYKRLKNEYFFDYYEDENGTQSYCCKEIYYNEMGGHTVFEYNQSGEVLSGTCYDPYGNKVS